MKEQTMKKLITLMMTFLLCLGSVAPAFAADKKKGYDAAAKHAIAVEATTGKILCHYLYRDWLYYQAPNSLYGL